MPDDLATLSRDAQAAAGGRDRLAHALPRHMPGLDGLRAVAILLVILTHVGDGWRRALMVVRDADWMAPLSLPAWPAAVAHEARLGVELFFVVSAFTLTASLTRRPLPLRVYALRRLARVAPGYWLAGIGYILVAGMGARLLAPDGTAVADLVSAALFASTLTRGAALAVVPGGWSVSCEVMFYLALPPVLLLVQARIGRAAALAAGLTVAAQAFARAVVFQDGGETALFSPVEHAPVFAYGVAAALVAMRVRRPVSAWVGLVPLAAAILVLPVAGVPGWYLMPQLPFGALCAVSVAAVALHPPRCLVHPLLRKVGEVSYSMYLVHWMVLPVSLALAERIFPANGWQTCLLHFVVTTGGSFAISLVTYRLVEQPFIRWSHHPAASGRMPAIP